MRKKKDLSLVILKALEPYVNLRGDKFEVIDKDSDSQFHLYD